MVLNPLHLQMHSFHVVMHSFMKGIKQILGVQSIFWDRETINKKLLEIAKSHKSQHAKEILQLGEVVLKRQINYLGHVIR